MKMIFNVFMMAAFLAYAAAFHVLPPCTRLHASFQQLNAVSPALAESAKDADDIPALKSLVSLAAFDAIDIRSGLIVKAETVPDPDHGGKPSRRFLSLVVDLGSEKRPVIAGIRPILDVEDAVGKKVLFAANVEPENVLGMSSQGRVLSIENYSKTPMPRSLRTGLLGPGAMPPGSKVTGL